MTIKLNKSYKEAHSTNKRYRLLFGGSGSGKSVFVAQETILNMLDDGEYHYLIIRKTGKSIRHSVFQQLTDMIRDYNLSQYFKIKKSDMSIECVTGATLITIGLEDV